MPPALKKEVARKIVAAFRGGMTREQIMREFGVGYATVETYAAGARNDCRIEEDREGTYLPSAEEIRAACAEIQAEWSPHEVKRRTIDAYRKRPAAMPASRMRTEPFL